MVITCSDKNDKLIKVTKWYSEGTTCTANTARKFFSRISQAAKLL
jgi:hypothetical protein